MFRCYTRESLQFIFLVTFQIIILDSLLLWGGVVDELDFAARLSQWSKHGFPELGDTVGWGIGRTVGKVGTQ